MAWLKHKKMANKKPGKWFKKKKAVEQEEPVILPVYGPHDTLVAQDYQTPASLAFLEQNFESCCKECLEKAKPDMYNKGYMNMLIDKVRKEALAELDEQEVFLKRVIYELGKIWRGDEVKAMGKLAEIKVEKKEVEEDLKRIERIYYRHTAFDPEYMNQNSFGKKEAQYDE